jgi:hypothetical protein
MIERPPKPDDKPSSPRFKGGKKKNKAPGTQTTLTAVRSLLDEQPLAEHFGQLQQEADAEKNDRGAAILLAANLENALQYTIEKFLESGGASMSELFGHNSPIGSFSSKIIIAHSLRILGKETRSNLDIIRTIRNAFAHARSRSRSRTKRS